MNRMTQVKNRERNIEEIRTALSKGTFKAFCSSFIPTTTLDSIGSDSGKKEVFCFGDFLDNGVSQAINSGLTPTPETIESCLNMYSSLDLDDGIYKDSANIRGKALLSQVVAVNIKNILSCPVQELVGQPFSCSPDRDKPAKSVVYTIEPRTLNTLGDLDAGADLLSVTNASSPFTDSSRYENWVHDGVALVYTFNCKLNDGASGNYAIKKGCSTVRVGEYSVDDYSVDDDDLIYPVTKTVGSASFTTTFNYAAGTVVIVLSHATNVITSGEKITVDAALNTDKPLDIVGYLSVHIRNHTYVSKPVFGGVEVNELDKKETQSAIGLNTLSSSLVVMANKVANERTAKIMDLYYGLASGALVFFETDDTITAGGLSTRNKEFLNSIDAVSVEMLSTSQLSGVTAVVGGTNLHRVFSTLLRSSGTRIVKADSYDNNGIRKLGEIDDVFYFYDERIDVKYNNKTAFFIGVPENQSQRAVLSYSVLPFLPQEENVVNVATTKRIFFGTQVVDVNKDPRSRKLVRRSEITLI